MTKLRENGATSGVGVLATLTYDDLGRRTGLMFGNGTSQTYGYDPVSRLASLTNDLAGTTDDLSQTLAYNSASQIASTVRTSDAYAWTGHFNQNATGTPNGLNQLTQVGAKSLTHDARGNVTAFGAKIFTYSSENLLLTGPNGTTLGYDPLMRLQQTASGATTLRLAYDSLDRIAEFDGVNALQRRYVHGPNMDEPFVWYEGSGTTDRRFLSSDERGSIISVTDSSGAVLGLNKFDEFGNPKSTNLGTWGYTGQAWLPTIGVWYYKAREYDPELGRFLQPDPIDILGGINLYAYVGNDPISWIDPLGLAGGDLNCANGICIDVVVVGSRPSHPGSATGGISGGAPGPRRRPITGFNTDSTGDSRGKMKYRLSKTNKLRQCEIDWLKGIFEKVGLPIDGSEDVTFINGISGSASIPTAVAYYQPQTLAVTQGNVVFVNPDNWRSATTAGSSLRYHEIFHTRQFANLGSTAFYGIYSVTGALYGRNNGLEASARGAGDALANLFIRDNPCGN